MKALAAVGGWERGCTALSQGWKKPGFKKKTSQVGFCGFWFFYIFARK
jgi:hypothetical protein